jgi:anti-sigma factor RsiW
VSCDQSRTTIHGYMDGELDAVRALEFERHLEGCADCLAALEATQSLRNRLQQHDLYERASPELWTRVVEQIDTVAPGRREAKAAPRWNWLAPALALAAVILLAVWFLAPRFQHGQTTVIATELVDAHVRSLQPGHLADVISTDQHTVKPWFDGKLDFVPPVNDYSEQGFPLLGGRLDVLNAHDVAALVYGRRKHLVNLFVWPARNGSIDDSSGSRDGYNWLAWRKGGMNFELVSDVSPADLRDLQQLLRQ